MLESSSLTFKSGLHALWAALKCISLLSEPKNRESYKQKDKKLSLKNARNETCGHVILGVFFDCYIRALRFTGSSFMMMAVIGA